MSAGHPAAAAEGVARAAAAWPVAAPACDARDHCITCSDEGRPMRVLAGDADGVALCEAEDGERAEVLTGVVGDVAPGDVLLVHAGTALLRLSGEAGA